MAAFRLISADEEGRMPTSRGLVCACFCAVVAIAATATAQPRAGRSTAAETLAKRVFVLADERKFSEVDLLLATLAESHPASDARVAAALYASQQTYLEGHRAQAAAWLKPLAASASQPLQAAVADAIAWCEVDPSDLKVPSARLLELAEQHSASSFAPAALKLRAEKLAAARRVDEAIFVYHALLAQFSQSRATPANLLAVARLHHELEQQREAWDYLQRLLKEHPQASQIDAALCLGVIVAQQLDDDATARAWLKRLVADHEQSPYWCDAACRLAEQQVAAGEAKPAKLLIARIIERSEKAKPQVEGEASGIADRATFLLVRLAVGENDWPSVERVSKDLLTAKVGEPLNTLARFWHAEAAYRRGDQESAFTRFLDLSLTIEGRSEDWLGVVPLRLAQIEALRQKWSTALEWAEMAAAKHPRYARMHEVDYVRGRSLAGMARFSEARDALMRVTGSETAAKSETAAMAQWLIGETYFQQRQYEQAIAAYEGTVSADFSQWRAAGLLQAAKCCEQLSRWSDAAQRYERLIRDYGDTRYVAEARARLGKTQAKVAAQTMGETTTR